VIPEGRSRTAIVTEPSATQCRLPSLSMVATPGTLDDQTSRLP
jgi:hypothetical protein